jgi:hypothetical protein
MLPNRIGVDGFVAQAISRDGARVAYDRAGAGPSVMAVRLRAKRRVSVVLEFPRKRLSWKSWSTFYIIPAIVKYRENDSDEQIGERKVLLNCIAIRGK